jgi:hypothetical protein
MIPPTAAKGGADGEGDGDCAVDVHAHEAGCVEIPLGGPHGKACLCPVDDVVER